MATNSILNGLEKSCNKILVVDDEPEVRELIHECLGEENYQCITARDGFEALQKIKDQSISVVITDIKMPGINGVELLRLSQEISPDTAFIMITGIVEMSTAVSTLKLGACDYISKPFNIEEVIAGVERALEKRERLLTSRLKRENLEQRIKSRTSALHKALMEVEQSYEMTLEALVAALDAREHETNSHSFRVQQYTLALARKVGIDGKKLIDIGRGALLHDIGKIGISDSILLKPAKLTADEWVEMRKHPSIGYRILQGIKFLEPVADIVLSHQEKYDGTGYPRGLKGKEIPIGARVFAIVDTLDAMTSNRPYRKALPFAVAREEIIKYSGTQFDDEIVSVFLDVPEEEWVRVREAAGSYRLENPLLALCDVVRKESI